MGNPRLLLLDERSVGLAPVVQMRMPLTRQIMARALLQTEGFIKRFGGVVPANAITLDIASDEVHAVIGRNGAAGKSTLLGLLSGEVTPQEGSIHFDGAAITRLPVYRRSRLGLARSFQITSLFHDFSALDNVALCGAGASRPLVSLLARCAPRGGIAQARVGGARSRRTW